VAQARYPIADKMSLFRVSPKRVDASSKPTRSKLLLGLLVGGFAVTAYAVAVTTTGTPNRDQVTADLAPVGSQTDRITVALALPSPDRARAYPALASAEAVADVPPAPLTEPAVLTQGEDEGPAYAPLRVAITGESLDSIVNVPDETTPLEVLPRGRWQTVTVGRGDTLSAIFKRLGLNQTTLHQLLQADGLGKELQRLRPGDEVQVRVDSGDLLELAHVPNALTTLRVTLGDGGWTAETVATPTETRTRFVGGVIEESLYLSALAADLDDPLIMELAGIFGWDVDFALDIRSGDRFGLIHEEIYAEDGTKLADGAILAASFTNRGKTFQAVRFTDPTGESNYFAPDGYSMRKAFLRSPVDFRRISSRFRGSRYHPVLGKKRPHRGVDYAAATGTPIKASGDGKVIHVGRKGGYGKAVILTHGGRYRTLYAHMSKYARGLRSGKRVRQGQTIGYVGSTGLATGPHLHYEFLVNGVHRNPLTVKLPKADPLDKKLLPDFRKVAKPLLAQLAVHEQTLLAQSDQ